MILCHVLYNFLIQLIDNNYKFNIVNTCMFTIYSIVYNVYYTSHREIKVTL